METMNFRHELMKKLVDEALERLQTEIAQPDNPRYVQVIKDLIVQGCIKFMEDKVQVKVREADLDMVQGMLEDCQTAYSDVMREQTGEEYSIEIELVEGDYIDPNSMAGKCGGIIMMNGKITCENTLDNRLHLCYEESLPLILNNLFPNRK